MVENLQGATMVSAFQVTRGGEFAPFSMRVNEAADC